DLDVLIGRLERDLAELPKADHDAAHRIVETARDDRADAYARLDATMSSPRYAETVAKLHDAAQHPYTPPEATAPARKPVLPLVRRSWRPLRRHVDALGPDAPDRALHRVRIDAKRCRYAAEAARPCARDDALRFASAIAAVQSVLGEHQDAVTAEAWL